MSDSLRPHLNNKNLKRFIVLLFVCFSIYPYLIDLFEITLNTQFNGLNSIGLYGDQNGYQIVNFVLCWILGAYVRKMNSKFNFKKCLIMIVFVCIVVLYSGEISLNLGGTLEQAFSYCNPFIIIQAVLLFMLFKHLKFGRIKWINELAKCSFTVYLVHSYLLKMINVDKYVNSNSFVFFIHIVFTIVSIYFICYCVYYVYSLLTNKLWYYLKSKVKLPQIIVDNN